MSTPILAARGLVVAYSGRTAVDRVDLNVRHAELVALVGPNGAGKSSLLAALAGLGPHTGSVLRCGCTGAQPTPGIAYVPQSPDLRTAFPLSAAQVVATGSLDARRWWRRPDAAQRAAAADAMERLDVADLAHRPFADLSGGQARRVLLARALAQGPKLLLLDEPHAGLDVEAATTLNTALAALAQAGTAVLASVHDLDLVRGAFTRTIVLDRRILADGPTSELLPAVGSLAPWLVA
ncbi:metal ABC transporter ATP-binding protein [Paeniglutamicibacter sulfureus]|uniref:ABC-type Mn2+/Zn2+ transport system ATPase subunit n=1 Tax=Paeniglutamicibacter sulfureus TaxID=43666 RepID=A0ABU2BK58_9MICC|nr:metal ABC transporter ATP-binding protein [Paeniglutamicibacter sulfureus]MDR7358108.1 ABC-type Mn2+/Zn2+ transport system ATPase subunit [Paeniglutamicibacter sulfureus]